MYWRKQAKISPSSNVFFMLADMLNLYDTNKQATLYDTNKQATLS